ncbi:MAG TPA: PP2C family protein-serine/threonine phosphatase [Jiangellales bacterium]|nr:PP2C family protein-serine/threonine phosphatase [Jiangellales bacterium]
MTTGTPRRHGARTRRWRWARARRRLGSEGSVLAGLFLLVLVLAVALHYLDEVPLAVLVLPLLLAMVALPLRGVVAVIVAVGVAVVVEGAQTSFGRLYFAVVLVVGATAVVALATARSRARLGVHGTMGESMLVDLRDRLRAQGELPELPRGWQAEVVHRSAGGATFSGDFLVSARAPGTDHLEVVLVDVSGKGLGAGTRALLLSGAFGGLLGSLPPADFLPAANAYLLRQGWGEGFATAVHLVLDLRTGHYAVRSAGHPPAVQFHAGSGRWQVLHSSGGLLGVFDHDEYEPVTGRLLRGDALLLYTDGLVETPQLDIYDGIDRLLGQAERLVTTGFRNGAHKLVEAVGNSGDDDRALVLLWRS